MATLVRISEVNIISIDKSEDSWEIEGEVLFEEDLSSTFGVTYLPVEDELDGLTLEIQPGNFDVQQLKNLIIEAAQEFDD